MELLPSRSTADYRVQSVRLLERIKDGVRDRTSRLGLNAVCISSGDPLSDVVVVGEGPGEKEAQSGVPMVGGAGYHLWSILDKYSGGRHNVYVTNVVKRQVSLSAKSNDRLSVGVNEVAHWKQILDWELAQLPNAKYIILCGNIALQACIDARNTGVSMWRGSIIEGKINERNVYYIATYNPGLIHHDALAKVLIRFDIGKLERLKLNKYEPYNIKYHLDPSYTEILRWLTKMRDEKKPVSFDIETMSDQTACIGITNDPHEGMCINFRHINENKYSVSEEARVLLMIQRFFNSSGLKLVAQNGHFDATWLWFKDRVRVPPLWFDTLLAHHTLYPSLSHSLAFLTTMYTDHPFYKDDGKTWRENQDIDQYWQYNIKDICITLKAQQSLLRELQTAKMDDFFFNHVMRLQPHLIHATVQGVLVDTAMKERVRDTLTSELDELKQKFYDQVAAITGKPDYRPSYNSRPALADLFFVKLGLIGKGVSVDKNNRKYMLNHPKTPERARDIIITIDQLKSKHKQLSTYATTKIDDDHRIRSEYKQFGTQSAPGRLSSSKTMWGTGTNMQNQPEQARDMYIADDGYTFVYFDSAQGESRIVGWKYRIQKWIDQYEQARLNPGTYDAHRALASEMFKIPYDDVPAKDFDIETKKHTVRYVAKRCRHGLNYRMQPTKLAEVTGLSLAEATNAYHIYHRVTPELQRHWKLIEAEALQSRVLYNAYGRRLIFLQKIAPGDPVLDSIIAFYPQSTLGDHISRTQYLSQEDPDWPKDAAFIPLNVHDSLTALVRIEHAERCARIMKKYAEAPIDIDGLPLIIPAETKISVPDEHGVRRWSNLKELKLN